MNPRYNFDSDHIDWQHIVDDSQGYSCDYKSAVLGADPSTGRLDLIVKWEPHAYCHFHRHVADTAILVLEGEQHITEIGADGSAHALDDFRGEAGTLLKGSAAVAIAAPIGGRPEELIDQIAVGGVNFHRVETEPLGVGRGAGPCPRRRRP